MDDRKVGILDSGLGGLTCAKEFMKILPDEGFAYFGDTGRVPYGSRSRRIIEKYTRQDINFLRLNDIKALIVACGTISSSVLESIKGDYDIPMIGVVEPACRCAAKATKNKKIGIIGTQATIKSGAYESCLKRVTRKKLEVFALSCPLFVPLVESGRFMKKDKLVKFVIEEYLAPLKDQGIDTLILGCTHYPILKPAIDEFFDGKVTLVDTGEQAALAAAKLLEQNDMLSGGKFCEQYYFVSDARESFIKWGSLILGEDIGDKVCSIEIEDY